MSQDLKCFFGLHKYEVLDTKELFNPYNIGVGQIIINRCSNCGKIHEKTIYTNSDYKR